MVSGFWRLLARTVVFLLALGLALGLLALSGFYVALAVLLYMRGGRDFRIDADRFAFWPDSLPAIDIYGRAAPAYLIGGLAALLIGIPLVLALLEKLYLRISTKRTESSGPADGSTTS